MNVTISDLFEAGVYLEHQKGRWNPKSKGFIYDHGSGISIIDLDKTYEQLESACILMQELVSKSQTILLVAPKSRHKKLSMRWRQGEECRSVSVAGSVDI